MKFLSLAFVLSLLSACATQTVTYTPAESESDSPNNPTSIPTETASSEPRPVATSPTLTTPAPISIAAESLAQLARTQYQAGQYQSAIATAERGLRIDRRTASLYLVLAQSYVQLGLRDKARNFVQQGLRYTNVDSDNEIQLLRLRDILNE